MTIYRREPGWEPAHGPLGILGNPLFYPSAGLLGTGSPGVPDMGIRTQASWIFLSSIPEIRVPARVPENGLWTPGLLGFPYFFPAQASWTLEVQGFPQRKYASGPLDFSDFGLG